MNPEWIVAILSAITIVWAIIRFTFIPHIREIVQSTVTPQVEKVPELTASVERLTAAIDRQSENSQRLETALSSLDGKVDTLNIELAHLAERTAALEGAAAVKRGGPRRRSA